MAGFGVSSQTFSGETKNPTGRFDFAIMASTAFLVLTGLLSIYSEGQGREHATFFINQIKFTIIGIAPFCLFAFTNPRFWLRTSNVLYVLNVLLLLSVLFLGKDIKGAQRWVEIGSMQFQPSEPGKLLAVLTLSSFYANRQDSITSLSTFLLGMAHMIIPVGLVFMQPHLGSVMVLMVMWLAVSVVAGVPGKYIGAIVAGTLVLSGLVFTVPAVREKVLHGYQSERILGMLGVFNGKGKDVKGKNYQTERAEIAFGVGGVMGSGFMRGEQKEKHFIPEQHSDFIFTVVGEEGGLVGSCMVLAVFAFLYYRIFLVMLRATDYYYRLIVAGVFAVLVFHTFVNIGMILQLVPVVGLWLPFLSYGGTALWLCMSCAALVLNIRARERTILF